MEKFWATYRVNERQLKSDFSPQVGQIIYNPQSEKMEVFDGEQWISIGSKTPATFDFPKMAKDIEEINTTLQNILEDSRSDGGNSNEDETLVSVEKLAPIFDRVIPENESSYQQAIIQATHLNNPPTADQIQTIIDAVNDDATPPIFTSPTVVSINENIGEDQLVYTAQATDSSLPIRYNIAASDIFLIDSNSGEVRLIPNPDYEDQAQYTVEITATDLALNQASLELVVNINDLDETPPINPILLEILEDSASPGGNNNQDNDPVTADELSQLVDNVDSNREQAYQQAIANHTQFSNPPTLTEIQAVVDAVNSTLDNVLEDSASPGGNNNQDNDPVTAAELSQIVDNVDINREQAYQQAIANHTQFSNPPTVAEIQAVVDAVNSTLNNVLEDSASPGGNNNQDNDPVTADELSQIVDNVDSNREQAYQQAIANHTQFSNPPTLTEIQAVVDAVNSTLDNVLEDSSSPGGNNNRDNDPVTADELSQIVDNVDPDREEAYQQAIANHTQFSNPPTLTEIQAE